MFYNILIKTVSEDCNMACEYCYYSHVAGHPRGIRVPSLEILQKLLRDYLVTCGPVASIAWQGGEPLLAGLNFFRQVVALEARYGQPRQIISNAVQTNGILLSPEWATFFRQYRFLVGVSLDGPQAIHDQSRVDAGGHGTFSRVMRGLACLRQNGVEFNILTVVGPHNVRKGSELLRFFGDSGLRWVQFIPQMAFSAQNSSVPGLFAITPQEYGDFLCETFDIWYNDGQPVLSIRYFDNVLQSYLGDTPEICTMQAQCPSQLTIESNGDIYACDFYMDEDGKIGNVMAIPLIDAFASEGYRRFAALKPALPEPCRECSWLKHCQGGCPRNRTWDPAQSDTADYFCESFKQFFAYADSRLRKLAKKLMRHRLINVAPLSVGNEGNRS